MSEIKKCENCGNENIEIINRYKGHYLCGKCGRDTEKLYEIEHDAEIRAKAIDEFAEKINEDLSQYFRIVMEDEDLGWNRAMYKAQMQIKEIAEQLKGGVS